MGREQSLVLFVVGAMLAMAVLLWWCGAAQDCAQRGGVLVRGAMVGWECVGGPAR